MGAPAELEQADSVKSVTLAELADFRPRRLGKILDLFRIALVAWGVLSLGAVAGIAVYYLNGGSATPLLIGENRAALAPTATALAPIAAAPAPTATAPAHERLAALIAPVETAAAAALPAFVLPEAPMPESLEQTVARLPRARPEAPIITGSIGPPAYDPYYVAPARRLAFDPCAALRNLGAPSLFGNRCNRQSRVYAPPPAPRQYTPHPYSPPLIIQK